MNPIVAIFCSNYAQGKQWLKYHTKCELNALHRRFKSGDLEYVLFWDMEDKDRLIGCELSGFIMLPRADHNWIPLAYSRIRNW